MWPLTDITIYEEKEVKSLSGFRLETNYICDMYHNKLDGYKPPKTSRICLHLREKRVFENPHYFGSICSCDIEFDFQKYQATTDKVERYKFILEHMHKSILEMADVLSWDKDVFITAYNSILQDNFKFTKSYPEKVSRDKKLIAQVTLEKNETRTLLNLKINNGQSFQTKLIDKRNTYWFDSGYQLASKMKWINKDTFGYKTSKTDREVYYSLSEGKVIKNFEFKDEDF